MAGYTVANNVTLLWSIKKSEPEMLRGIQRVRLNYHLNGYFSSFGGVPNCLLCLLSVFGVFVFTFCTKCAFFSLFDVSVKATCVDMSMCPAGHERCCASKRVTERDLLQWDLGTPVSRKTSGLLK